jgi:hypothetical protein
LYLSGLRTLESLNWPITGLALLNRNLGAMFRLAQQTAWQINLIINKRVETNASHARISAGIPMKRRPLAGRKNQSANRPDDPRKRVRLAKKEVKREGKRRNTLPLPLCFL